MADRFLLDTSAIFALTDLEEGADQVESLLDLAAAGGCEVEICSASLMELYYVTLQGESEDAAAALVAVVRSWPITWVYPGEKELLQAARIKAFHRLSFADAVIAGTAKVRGATLVHKDPEYESLAQELALLSLPFKTSG